MDDPGAASFTIWRENALKIHGLDDIHRLSEGDYRKKFIFGEPQQTPTMTVDQLKAKKIIGIYQIITEVRYR